MYQTTVPFFFCLFFASPSSLSSSFFFFFNDPAPPEIYPLPLHDALPISRRSRCASASRGYPSASASSSRGLGRDARRRKKTTRPTSRRRGSRPPSRARRSEEHTSELQSRSDLVCRLLLEKKKK